MRRAASLETFPADAALGLLALPTAVAFWFGRRAGADEVVGHQLTSRLTMVISSLVTALTLLWLVVARSQMQTAGRVSEPWLDWCPAALLVALGACLAVCVVKAIREYRSYRNAAAWTARPQRASCDDFRIYRQRLLSRERPNRRTK